MITKETIVQWVEDFQECPFDYLIDDMEDAMPFFKGREKELANKIDYLGRYERIEWTDWDENGVTVLGLEMYDALANYLNQKGETVSTIYNI